MAIKALEDALREKDQAMERERTRLNNELDFERKKRNDLEIQINNPEEGKIGYKKIIKVKLISIRQNPLSSFVQVLTYLHLRPDNTGL